MKTYKAKLKGGAKGVYAISLVENPAMEGNFIALKEENIALKTLDEEKRLLIGLVLEPNKPVYRNQNGEEFNLIFDETTITDLAHSFIKNGYQLNSTLEHEEQINGVSFVESWIVEDSKNDKSNVYGFSYPKGSWIATMKVDNDDVWNGYVKTGKVKGFSIDAMLDLELVNLKKENMNETKIDLSVITDAIKKGFESVFPKKIEMGKIQSGELTLEFEGEMLTVGGSVYVVNTDGERVPLPVGEYELENGLVLKVNEEGYVGELVEPSQEPEPEQEMSQDGNDMAEQISNAIKSIMIKYKEDFSSKITEVVNENLALKKEVQVLNEKFVKLSEQPAEKKKIATPSLKKSKSLIEFLNER